MSTPTYIREFVEAIYPDAPDLALASFNEEKCIRDATALIVELQAAQEALRHARPFVIDAGDGEDPEARLRAIATLREIDKAIREIKP